MIIACHWRIITRYLCKKSRGIDSTFTRSLCDFSRVIPCPLDWTTPAQSGGCRSHLDIVVLLHALGKPAWHRPLATRGASSVDEASGSRERASRYICHLASSRRNNVSQRKYTRLQGLPRLRRRMIHDASAARTGQVRSSARMTDVASET